ncbi:MAG: CoA pyrophosphatase [Eubacteriales bacterium]|nr:CoA pyrophosphatase [Eubacteriales bacterium]
MAEGDKKTRTEIMTDGNKKENTSASAENLRAWITEAEKCKERACPRGSSAVLIPVLIRDGSYHVLYEVRAAKLHTQPGEVCFPGGRIEQGETPLEAAIRETTEELCIRSDQIEIVGALDATTGPGGIPFYAFISVLHDYHDTYSREEVDHIFTLPLDWILEEDPDIYQVHLRQQFPEDFPFESVPGGENYHWKERTYPIPFYPGTDPMLWGVTARVTHSLARYLRLAMLDVKRQ